MWILTVLIKTGLWSFGLFVQLSSEEEFELGVCLCSFIHRLEGLLVVSPLVQLLKPVRFRVRIGFPIDRTRYPLLKALFVQLLLV